MLAAASLIVLAAAAGQPGDIRSAPPLCQDEKARVARGRRGAAPHRLNEEPNADVMLAVVRSQEGCSRPVRVRRDVGSRAPR